MKPLLEKGNGEKRLEYVKLHKAQNQTSCENRSSKEMRKSQTASTEKSNSEFLQPCVKLSRGSYEGLGLHFTHWCLGSRRNWWIYEGRKELLDFNPPCNTISQNNSKVMDVPIPRPQHDWCSVSTLRQRPITTAELRMFFKTVGELFLLKEFTTTLGTNCFCLMHSREEIKTTCFR